MGKKSDDAWRKVEDCPIEDTAQAVDAWVEAVKEEVTQEAAEEYPDPNDED